MIIQNNKIIISKEEYESENDTSLKNVSFSNNNMIVRIIKDNNSYKVVYPKYISAKDSQMTFNGIQEDTDTYNKNVDEAYVCKQVIRT